MGPNANSLTGRTNFALFFVIPNIKLRFVKPFTHWERAHMELVVVLSII
jgi:hypothetical protein